MAVTITRCALGARDAMGKQLADSIDVADGAVSAALTAGLYRIKATTACTVRIGTGLANANNGEPWAADETYPRFIEQGDVVAVNAA